MRRVVRAVCLASLACSVAWAGEVPAASVEPPPALPPSGINVNVTWDAAVTGSAFALSFAAPLISVDTNARWQHQLLPFDARAERNFSASAASFSDAGLGMSIALPLALQLGQGTSAEVGKRCLVYGETLALSIMVTSFSKRIVGRPRPYVYSDDPQIQAFAADRARGGESHESFFSGHASRAFSAAVAGSYLFAQSTDDVAARTVVWAVTLGLASATADLRVRAGQHFPSDVLAGAAVGAAIGWVVPAWHYRGRQRRSLSAPEWVAIVVAPLLGVALGQVLPIRSDVNQGL